MKIEDVKANGAPLVLATPAQVDALASRLWITFPAGYHAFITRFGEGVLGGTFVRIYPPWRIEKELAEWRRRIGKYWFWDAGSELLPKERALESIIIGDTVNGDELVFHPCRPDRLFVLPRDSGRIFEAGADLFAAIDWMCASGELAEPFVERNFEPLDSRLDGPVVGGSAGSADPEGESLDDILEIGKRWAERHSARTLAHKDLRQHSGAGKKTELLYESFVVDGKFPHEPGYAVAWRIIDKLSGADIGLFRWHRSDGTQGSAFEPALGKGSHVR